MHKKRSVLILLSVALLLAACSGSDDEGDSGPATNTLAPIISLTPRITATPFVSRTPLPTFTPTPTISPVPPTPSDTPTVTPTQPITGIVSSLEAVRIRQGPSTTESIIIALTPGTGVEVLGQNVEGNWYNVRYITDEGRVIEGWMSARLVRLNPTATPFPTSPVPADQTALAQGTALPTAVIGGGTVTPTPPLSAVSATPPGTPGAQSAEDDAGTTTPTESFLPIRDPESLDMTATALAAGAVISPPPTIAAEGTPSPGGTATAGSPNVVDTATPTIEGTTPTPRPTSSGAGTVREGVDVFALCDNPTLGPGAPTDLAAGSTIDIFWAWIVSDEQYVDEHLENVIYEVRVNGELLQNWRNFRLPVREQGSNYAIYWFVPFGPLQPGEYRITYRATWEARIFDGWEFFGPGTRNPIEEGTCTFTVQ